MTVNTHYYIGWDVGGWNCDHNPNSRDAIVILDAQLNICGLPWRGNLRDLINQAQHTQAWMEGLFDLCGLQLNDYDQHQFTMAIDTPLGFSDSLRTLINQIKPAGIIEDSSTNPYLYRKTEQVLFERGFKPLSAIKDMIGSQATKGLHVLGKFATDIRACGVWGQGTALSVFEGYPSACKKSEFIQTLLNKHFRFISPSEPKETPKKEIDEYVDEITSLDQRDALICALLAWAFEHHPDSLLWPDAGISEREGWIFVPVDG